MRVFYIDDVAGDDQHSGQSQEQAWKTLDRVNRETFLPGDRILFRSGGSWDGMLCPSGSGTSEQPIVVDQYDAGASEESAIPLKPLIAGNGAEAAIKLDGVNYWTIRNMRATNDAAERALRSGIAVYGKAGMITSGIRIERCEVFDVKGENRRSLATYTSMYWNSGIYVSIPGRTSETSHLNDIIIVDNDIHDVWTSGIRVNQQEDFINDIHHTHVIVRGNTIARTGTDGIIVANCISPIIEYNRCFDAGALGSLEDTQLIAGVWVCATSDALIQYNEVARTRLFENDGTAFDTDWGNAGTIVFQYNYTHHNEGGFWLDCAGFNHNAQYVQTILRHNISINDGRCIVQSDTGLPALLEHNLFYQSEAAVELCTQAEGQSHMYKENTFYFPSQPIDGWKASTFENNRYSSSALNPADQAARIVATVDEQLLPVADELDGKKEKWLVLLENN